MTASDQHPPATAALRALAGLINTGGWVHLPSGSDELLIFMHVHDDSSVDILAIQGEDDALAERTNPNGDPVWRHEGTLVEVIDELRAVPRPGEPNAPRLVLAGRSATRELKNSVRHARQPR